MASICNDKNGTRRIVFVASDGKRKTIRLGKISKRNAEAVKVRVEQLIAASLSQTAPDDETTRWVTSLDSKLADRLAAVGLIAERDSTQLGPFLNAYIASREDARPNTIRNLKNSAGKLIDYFGRGRSIRSILQGDADEWRQALLNSGLAEATISKAVKHAKQFLKVAVRKELITTNPFQDLKSGSERNVSRLRFVERKTIGKVIEAAPDAEWRLLIALARYGGLRTPSETLALKWEHIDWQGQRFTVPSPKTERHGKAFRVVPLFPELLTYLEAAWEQTSEGEEYVINRYRGDSTNLRTQFMRIIRRASVEPWPRLFQNLRASCETELANEFPLHVVTSWLGNSPTVADRHYLKTTEEHFEKAARNPARKAAQSVHVGGSGDSQRGKGEHPKAQRKTPVLQGETSVCGALLDGGVNTLLPPRGVEPLSPP